MKLASTLSRPRWGMPITISLTPSWLPRLRICSSAGIDGLAAVEAEALGAGVFACRGSARSISAAVSRSRIARLPLLGERGLVADALDALLDPGLLRRILDVHVLDADLAAIGLAHDLQDLAQRRGLEAEHVVDEDRPVEVGFGEAVGRGVELGMALASASGRAGRDRPPDGRARDRRGSASARGSNPWPRRAHLADAGAVGERAPRRCRAAARPSASWPFERSMRRLARRPAGALAGRCKHRRRLVLRGSAKKPRQLGSTDSGFST